VHFHRPPTHRPTRILVIIEIASVILNRLNSQNIVQPPAHLNTFKEPHY